ncbi:unnamed protein product [Aspergillus oryzae RIB40]|uniref:DNA, SC038 n=1 Tax=Aspergillus oryzae (strain ATCC 42149 / RIB 40) TaxID=510516 RepID=Q2U382_ASPOR|nr:unnamed protein product [Aspergillus oryzae RIB40]BAE63983.1 unnamed protein product [Aspergillus oryzae RIB40]
MISKSLTAGIEVSRMTDPQHASQLSSILINAFSHDEIFKIECPDESSINDMKTETESTIEAIVQNTGPGGASVWTAQTESGQIVGYAQWKHAVCLPDQDTEQYECSGSLLSAPELYGNLSAMKRAVLMKSTPFHLPLTTESGTRESSIEIFCMALEPKTVPPHARHSPNGTRGPMNV